MRQGLQLCVILRQASPSFCRYATTSTCEPRSLQPSPVTCGVCQRFVASWALSFRAGKPELLNPIAASCLNASRHEQALESNESSFCNPAHRQSIGTYCSPAGLRYSLKQLFASSAVPQLRSTYPRHSAIATLLHLHCPADAVCQCDCAAQHAQQVRFLVMR